MAGKPHALTAFYSLVLRAERGGVSYATGTVQSVPSTVAPFDMLVKRYRSAAVGAINLDGRWNQTRMKWPHRTVRCRAVCSWLLDARSRSIPAGATTFAGTNDRCLLRTNTSPNWGGFPMNGELMPLQV